MKTLLLLTAALFIVAAAPAHAGDTLLKATVSGTVQTQTLLSLQDGRIHTAPLNNKRIFQEFQVSPADYELVVTAAIGSALVLVPKHTGAMLPSITVAAFGSDNQLVADTKVHLVHVVSDLAKGTATNLFQNLSGEAAATLKYTGSPMAPVFTKCNFSVTGHGTASGGSNSSALLKFKVTSGGLFTQAP